MKNYQEFLNESNFSRFPGPTEIIDSPYKNTTVNMTGGNLKHVINPRTNKASVQWIGGFPKAGTYLFVQCNGDAMGDPTKLELMEDYRGDGWFIFDNDGIELSARLKMDKIDDEQQTIKRVWLEEQN